MPTGPRVRKWSEPKYAVGTGVPKARGYVEVQGAGKQDFTHVTDIVLWGLDTGEIRSIPARPQFTKALPYVTQ